MHASGLHARMHACDATAARARARTLRCIIMIHASAKLIWHQLISSPRFRSNFSSSAAFLATSSASLLGSYVNSRTVYRLSRACGGHGWEGRRDDDDDGEEKDEDDDDAEEEEEEEDDDDEPPPRALCLKASALFLKTCTAYRPYSGSSERSLAERGTTKGAIVS